MGAYCAKSKYLGFRISRHLIDSISKRARALLTSEFERERHIKELRTYGTIDQPARVLPLAVRRSRGRGDRESSQRSAVAQEQRVRRLVRGAERCESGYVTHNTRVKIFLSLNNQSFLLYLSLCVCVFSLSLCFESERAKKNVVILSLLSLRGCDCAHRSSKTEREREREMENFLSKRRSLLGTEEFGEISFR